MKKRSTAKKLISVLILSVMMLTSIFDYVPEAVYAGNAREESTVLCINTAAKYLYLGDSKADKYDFDIVNPKAEAVYTWYVKADKGSPEAVAVDSKTGMVTAKEAGTAYVRCKVVLKDGTILRPETKVIVVNNITGVKINNLPENMTINAGKEMDFNRTITDTKAGKGRKTNGITRWEIVGDSAGVIEADDKGIVFPAREGQFRIRAVSFQSVDKYNLWLLNKEKNKDCLTAKSEWQTIKVTASDGSASVNTQDQLDKALASPDFSKITLQTLMPLALVIKSGVYSDKALIVDALNADVKNYGIFKDITIKAIKDTTWIEYANGNIVHLLDTMLHFVIDTSANVKQITVEQKDSAVDFEIHGKIDLISVLSSSTINITGGSANVPVIIESGAKGSSITTSVPLNLTLNENAEIKLKQGSEGSGIDKKASSVEVKIENNTSQSVIVTTNKTGAEIIPAGDTKISNETSVPVSVPSSGTGGGFPDGSSDVPVGVSGLTISPQNMVVSVSGSAFSVLVAVITPDSAAASEVTWRSVNESVAKVDGDGTVIPVSVGVTPVIAAVGGKTAEAYITVVESVTGSAIQSGMLHSAGSTIAEELAKGAVAYVGGELMGWGLSEMGIGFKDETQEAIKEMSRKLDEISNKLDVLFVQMNQLKQQIIVSEYNVRVGQLEKLLSNIATIGASLNDFIKNPIKDNPSLLESSRNELISSIKLNLINNEEIIHEQLMGIGGQEPLYKVWSRAVKGSKRFLNSEDSAKVQSMYDFFEMMQTTMLELEVEYYHAIGEGGENCNNINRILKAYDDNIKEQRALLLLSIPENALLDTKNNMMIYKGYFYHHMPLFGNKELCKARPLYATVGYKDFCFQCDNMGFKNWRWLDGTDLKAWIKDGKGDLYNYLIASGWDMPMNISEKIAESYDIIFGDYIDGTTICGYNVGSGEKVSDVTIRDGSGVDLYNPMIFDGALQYTYYWYRVRDMDANEIGNYFW